ncbi:uncharacterized protein PpBr36_06775 [Pyricularia pennisetigena]|nr:uncharacterized protein PpBr36_06775 [Pyricularia pennisetigena]TLS23240.1 hypothetical protein PpBr36_06775 [Pyricularia pennisetigena]
MSTGGRQVLLGVPETTMSKSPSQIRSLINIPYFVGKSAKSCIYMIVM